MNLPVDYYPVFLVVDLNHRRSWLGDLDVVGVVEACSRMAEGLVGNDFGCELRWSRVVGRLL